MENTPSPVLHRDSDDSETIYNESSKVSIDPQDKHKIEVFEDYYIMSFNEDNLYSLLFVSSLPLLEQAFATIDPFTKRCKLEIGRCRGRNWLYGNQALLY